MVDVQIEMAPEDWDALKSEGRGPATTMSDFTFVAYLGNGTLTLDEAGMTEGDQISGRFEGLLAL